MHEEYGIKIKITSTHAISHLKHGKHGEYDFKIEITSTNGKM